MSCYLVKFQPLELYTIGTEQGARYNGAENAANKESYIMTSQYVPDQTTILGTLRYLILKKNQLLHADFNYQEEELAAQKQKIGPESFKFTSASQSFGIIKKMSPLFISNDKNEILIPNPFCNASGDKYEPIKMGEIISTSYGEVQFPEKYNAKDGHGSGYLNIHTDKVLTEEELFQKHVLTCNQITSGKTSDADAFYKREVIEMAKGCSFCVYLELSEECFPDHETMIAYMGLKGNTFKVTFLLMTEEQDLQKTVETAAVFQNTADQWFYALSDVYPGKSLELTDFAIIEEKYIRNIETQLKEKEYIRKRKKGERIHLIKAGSCFRSDPNINENRNCKNIGYNAIIKIGGNK